MENPLVHWQRRSSCACGVNRMIRQPAASLRCHLFRWRVSSVFPFVGDSGFILGSKRGCTTSGAWPARETRWCHLRLDSAWTFWTFHLRMDAWTARQCSLSRIPLLPYTIRAHYSYQRWLISSRFLFLHLLSLGRLLLHPTSRSVSSAQTAGIPTQRLSRNSEREILCVRVVGWSLATVLSILGASGGYVLPDLSYVLASRSPVFPKTFANDEGDDPSRVGIAADLLMEGMEQLDTTIGFKDGGTGIARELQRGNTFPRFSWAKPSFCIPRHFRLV